MTCWLVRSDIWHENLFWFLAFSSLEWLLMILIAIDARLSGLMMYLKPGPPWEVNNLVCWLFVMLMSALYPKLYIPSTLNIDLILWHTQLIVCAENVKSWFKSWVFPFTFQAYILPYTLNCMCVSLLKFHIWILEQF